MTTADRIVPMCVVLALLTAAACQPATTGTEQQGETAAGTAAVEGDAATDADLVARGEHLVLVLDCDACHTPKLVGAGGLEPDLSRRLSGHPAGDELSPPPALGGGWMGAHNTHLTAWAGPWGITYAPNLTPDEITGLGIWTERMFIDSIRTGRHMGTSRPIQPPMPWMAYANLDDEDLRAVFAYLTSLPPIRNEVPAYQPPAGE